MWCRIFLIWVFVCHLACTVTATDSVTPAQLVSAVPWPSLANGSSIPPDQVYMWISWLPSSPSWANVTYNLYYGPSPSVLVNTKVASFSNEDTTFAVQGVPKATAKYAFLFTQVGDNELEELFSRIQLDEHESSSDTSLSLVIIGGCVVAGVLLVLIIGLACCYVRQQKEQKEIDGFLQKPLRSLGKAASGLMLGKMSSQARQRRTDLVNPESVLSHPSPSESCSTSQPKASDMEDIEAYLAERHQIHRLPSTELTLAGTPVPTGFTAPESSSAEHDIDSANVFRRTRDEVSKAGEHRSSSATEVLGLKDIRMHLAPRDSFAELPFLGGTVKALPNPGSSDFSFRELALKSRSTVSIEKQLAADDTAPQPQQQERVEVKLRPRPVPAPRPPNRTSFGVRVRENTLIPSTTTQNSSSC